jgi:hypothetical protein
MDTSDRTRRVSRAAVVSVAVIALSLVLPRAFAAPAAPEVTSPTQGGTVSGLGAVTIRGTASAGATVEVVEGLTTLGSPTADADGAWSVSATLADGDHTVSATASDETGTSAPTLVTFTVDAVRPAVDIASPEADHVFGPGETPAVTGTASDDRGLYAIRLEYWTLGARAQEQLAECDGCDGSTTASWQHEPALEPGDWLVKAFAVDQGGNYSLQATRRFVNVNEDLGFNGPELPEVELPEGITPPEITTPGEGETEPGAEGPIVIGGSTEPGSDVELYEEFQGLGKIGTAADEDEDGHWQISVRLPTGTYAIAARARDEEGNVSALGDLITFTVDGERPTIEMLTQTNRVFLPTEDIVLEGTVADNFEAAWVVLEYYNLEGELALRDTAECAACPASGASWTHEPTLPFGPGTYTVKVWAFDVAGNASHQRSITIVKSI